MVKFIFDLYSNLAPIFRGENLNEVMKKSYSVTILYWRYFSNLKKKIIKKIIFVLLVL